MASKKSVLITGCSEGGIGDAFAKEFQRKGFRVFASARSPAKIAHLKEAGIETVIMDVTNPESIRTAVKELSAATDGRLDFLINNSGSGYMMPLMDVDINEARKMFDVNVFAIIGVTQAFAPLLIKAKGVVANNSSVNGVFALPLQGMYNASKAAVSQMTHTMRIELAPFDVKVVDLVTGAVRTKFFDNIPSVSLPPNSLYTPNKDFIEKKMTGDDISVKVHVDTYARRVVSDLTKSHPSAQIWRGGAATLVWFLVNFLPYTALDGIFGKQYGLNDLRSKLRSG